MASVVHFAALFGIIWLIQGAPSHYNQSTKGNREQSVHNTDQNNTQKGDFYFQEQRTNENNVLIGRTIHKTAWSEENENQDESQSVNTEGDTETKDEWNITNLLKYILSLVYKYEETKEIPPDINHEKEEKQIKTTKGRQTKEEENETEGNNIDKTFGGVPKSSEQKHQNQKPESNYLNSFYQSEYIKWINSDENDEYPESSSDSAEDDDDDMFYQYEDSNIEKIEITIPSARPIQNIGYLNKRSDGEKENEDKQKFQCCKNKGKIYPREKRIEQTNPKSKEENNENNAKGTAYTKSSDNFHTEENNESKENNGESNQLSKIEKCVKRKTEESQDNEYEKVTAITPYKNQNDKTGDFADDISSYTTKSSKHTNSHSNQQNENVSETNSLYLGQNPTSDAPKELTLSIRFYEGTPSPLSYSIPEETSKIVNDTKSENKDETQIESPTEDSVRDDKKTRNENQPNASNEPVYKEKEDKSLFLKKNDQQSQQTSISLSENQNGASKPKAITSSTLAKYSSSSHLDDNEGLTADPRNVNDKYQSYNFKSYSDLYITEDSISGTVSTPSVIINDGKSKMQPEYLQNSNSYYSSTIPYSASENLKNFNNLGQKSSGDFNNEREGENENNEPEDSKSSAERSSNSRNQKKSGVEHSEPHDGNSNPELGKDKEQNMNYVTPDGNNMQDKTNDSDLHSPSPEEPDKEFQNQKNEMSNETPEDVLVDKEDSMKKDGDKNAFNIQESNFDDEYYDYIKSSNEFIEVQKLAKNLTEHAAVKENDNNDETDSENMATDSIATPSQLSQLTKNYKEQEHNYNENPNQFTETQKFSFKHVEGNEINKDKDSGETDSKNTEEFPQLFKLIETEPESQEHFDTILEYLYKYSNNSLIQSLKNQSKDYMK